MLADKKVARGDDEVIRVGEGTNRAHKVLE